MYEPGHIEKYAPSSAMRGSLKSETKQRQQRPVNALSHIRMNTDKRDFLNQGRVLAGLHQDVSHHIVDKSTGSNTCPESARIISQDTGAVSLIKDLMDFNVLDLKTNDYDANDYHLNKATSLISSSPQNYTGVPLFNSDTQFDDIISGDDLLMLAIDIGDTPLGPASEMLDLPAKRSTANLYRIDSDLGSLEGTLIAPTTGVRDSVSESLSKKFVSSVILTTELVGTSNNLKSLEACNPIVRPSFTAPVRDNSPIIGLSSMTLLRTCFRIGEAINQSCQAARSGKHVVIELNARVLHSQRTDSKQFFTFCDIFHSKAPHIKAVYDASRWKRVQLFEYDSRRLLQTGKMCRCIGTMKREGKEWVMNVLNIWEATWEDIKWVEGIVSTSSI